MKAIGLVFLYEREKGAPQDISRAFFGEHLSVVTENLIKQKLMGLLELKEILDSRSIYWAGIKENFKEVLNNDETIGKLAWKIFKEQSGKEASGEVKSLVYNGSKVPWNFTLMACVLYK